MLHEVLSPFPRTRLIGFSGASVPGIEMLNSLGERPSDPSIGRMGAMIPATSRDSTMAAIILLFIGGKCA